MRNNVCHLVSLSTSPRPDLLNLLDAGPDADGAAAEVAGTAAATKWKAGFADLRVKDVTEKGHKDCGYVDSREALVGRPDSGWVRRSWFFLRLPSSLAGRPARLAPPRRLRSAIFVTPNPAFHCIRSAGLVSRAEDDRQNPDARPQFARRAGRGLVTAQSPSSSSPSSPS